MPDSRVGRDALLMLLMMPALVGVAVVAQGEGSFFPQQYSREFFVAKGIVGVIAVTLLLTQMSRTWPRTLSTGQRLRYLSLLVGTVAVASGSSQQFVADQTVTGLNVAGLVFVTTTVIAMVVSLREEPLRH